MDVLIARDIYEALRLKKKYPSYLFINGGTDLLVKIKKGMLDLEGVIDISSIPELKKIEKKEDYIYIGAGVTFTEIIENEIIKMYLPELIKAVSTIGVLQIRNRATIGGNIINASPAGDSLPALYALDAHLVLKTEKEEREVNIEEFIYGPGKTLLKNNEILYKVKIKPFEKPYVYDFFKVGSRKAQTISKASLFVVGKIKNDRLIANIAIGSCGPTVIRAEKTEKYLRKNSLFSSNTIDEVSNLIIGEISPITDVRSTENYRRKVIVNLFINFLKKVKSSL